MTKPLVDNHGMKDQMGINYHLFEPFGLKKMTIIIDLPSPLIISIHPIYEVQYPRKMTDVGNPSPPPPVVHLFHLNHVQQLNFETRSNEPPKKTKIIP